jgi:hypothetical protein
MSSAATSGVQSSSSTPAPSSSGFLTPYSRVLLPRSRRADIRLIAGKHMHQASRPENKRRGSKRSAVWDHGDTYLDPNQEGGLESWICDYCDSTVILRGNQSTSNIRRHLIDKHKISFPSGADAVWKPFDDDYSSSKRALSDDDDDDDDDKQPLRKKRTPSPLPRWKRLYTTVNIHKFRQKLIRFVVHHTEPFNVVSDSSFRDLIIHL